MHFRFIKKQDSGYAAFYNERSPQAPGGGVYMVFVNTETGKPVHYWDPDLCMYQQLTGLGAKVRLRHAELTVSPVRCGFIADVTAEGIALSTDPDKLIPLEEFFEKYERVD